jgi:hypothetical protein
MANPPVTARSTNNSNRPTAFPEHPLSARGRVKQASFEKFLKDTQTTSFIIIKDGAILYLL